ncbi:hypothetical protein AWJ20_1706 [Sugiyamaella lignohabitans]|uniref:Uncharacterized protein n=1 Tax=Sugiyamaella lignohabitans TaxID=796027 RepID=A0A167DXK6_9ASCO|nr:uncharacterized protein AWJ20_1706 [Sugiyamaella lignohabitans]ANB13415.1 hypothetical protein AWJ20_1706 [Sugiyamaella lignohabitans]
MLAQGDNQTVQSDQDQDAKTDHRPVNVGADVVKMSSQTHFSTSYMGAGQGIEPATRSDFSQNFSRADSEGRINSSGLGQSTGLGIGGLATNPLALVVNSNSISSSRLVAASLVTSTSLSASSSVSGQTSLTSPQVPQTPFQSFKPHRNSSLHHVTSFQTPPDMSPISPSATAPSHVATVNTPQMPTPGSDGSSIVGSTAGISSFSSGLYVKSHPSSRSSSRRNSRTAHSSNSIGGTTPALYFGPSSSVSSLGHESGFLLKRNEKGSSAASRRYRSSSSSSSDDDDLISAGYDSDDRMSLGSRRASVTSTKGSDIDITPPAAIVRQMISNGRSLKPKMKSFLRISKDLQEELSPLDFEIRREAEVTSTFREEDAANPRRVSVGGSIAIGDGVGADAADGSNCNVIAGGSSSGRTSMSSFHHQELIARLESFAPGGQKDSDAGSAIISDTEDSDAPPISVTPSVKRKIAFLDDSPVNGLKRRAVSPGLSSPVIGSPTSHVNRRASIKQVYETSDGFQNLQLI